MLAMNTFMTLPFEILLYKKIYSIVSKELVYLGHISPCFLFLFLFFFLNPHFQGAIICIFNY